MFLAEFMILGCWRDGLLREQFLEVRRVVASSRRGIYELTVLIDDGHFAIRITETLYCVNYCFGNAFSALRTTLFWVINVCATAQPHPQAGD